MYIAPYMSVIANSYSMTTARAKLSEIVDEAEGGHDVEITRRGKKVAVVVSATRFASLTGDRLAFATAYERFRRAHDLAQTGFDPGWSRALREAGPGRKVKP